MKKLILFQYSFALLFIFSLFTIKISAQCFSQQNYNTAGTYSFIIPGDNSEEYRIEISSKGADGAPYKLSGTEFAKGGEGAFMKASYTVNGGDELTIFVGQAGYTGGSPSGGGAGGGSAVIINASAVLIASAAGGGGGNGYVG